MRFKAVLGVGLGLLCAAGRIPAPVSAQRGGMFQGSADDPAIKYSTAPLNNVVAALNEKLQEGAARLTFEGRSGYLAVRARGAGDSGPIADARLLADEPAGAADQRRQSAGALLHRSRRARLGAGRRRPRSGRTGCLARHRLLHAGSACRRRPAVQAGHDLSRVSRQRRHARRPWPADVQHDAVRRTAARQIDHDGPSESPERALGRLVRDRQQRFGRPHGKHGGRARRSPEPRALVGRRTVRRGGLSLREQRHRRAPRVFASDADDRTCSRAPGGKRAPQIRRCTRPLSPRQDRTSGSRS